ncbi:MAG: hypothetical protein Q9182_004621 [Xanthomendoza sp. 2 TL-2023]
MLYQATLLLALTATITALPNALPPTKRSAAPAPQYSFPWGGGGGGGGSTGTYTTGNTANDITNKTPCKPLTIIFARGTNERGNLGSVIGPPLYTALKTKLGAEKIAYQGVPYPASPAGNANGGGTGGALMASLAQQAIQQCPSTKIILSGYSQGGSVVHRAGPQLGSTPIAAGTCLLSPSLPVTGTLADNISIATAVIFGDPSNGSPVTNVANLKEYCAQGDNVCGTPRTFAITAAHASYGRNGDAGDAAGYIAGVTGVS